MQVMKVSDTLAQRYLEGPPCPVSATATLGTSGQTIQFVHLQETNVLAEGSSLSPKLSGQNLRAVQLQIRYISSLPQGLKTWLKSFFSFFKVFFSTPFRKVSCPQWKTPQNINNHKKTESRVFATSSTGEKNRKMCSIQVVTIHVIRCCLLLLSP